MWSGTGEPCRVKTEKKRYNEDLGIQIGRYEHLGGLGRHQARKLVGKAFRTHNLIPEVILDTRITVVFHFFFCLQPEINLYTT